MSHVDGGACRGRPGEAAGYVAGFLDRQGKGAFERHMVGCHACREAVRRQRHLDMLVERLPRYRAPERVPRRRHRLRRAFVPALASAALLVAVFAVPRGEVRPELLAATLAAHELTFTGDFVSLYDREPIRDRVDEVPWLGFVTCSGRIAPSSSGLYLCALDEDGPLGAVGVEPGESIRSIDGHPVDDSRALSERLVAKEIGGTFRVGLERLDGSEHEVVVATVPFELGENHPFDMSWSPALLEHARREDPLSPSSLFAAIDDSLAARLEVTGGVRVLRRLAAAQQAQSLLAGFHDLYGSRGLRAGHVIVAVDEEPVTTVAELFMALAGADQRPFSMTVHRLGAEATLLHFNEEVTEEREENAGVTSVGSGQVHDPLVAHAVSFLQKGEALAEIWPGFFATGSSFMMIDDSVRMTLLVRRGPPPPGFLAVLPGRLPEALKGLAYLREGYPEGLGEGTYQADYELAGDTLPALPLKGSTVFQQRDFYFHESFHGYQAEHFPPLGRRVRFGEHLVDPELLDEEFRGSADEERRLLREALSATYREQAFQLLGRYFDLRESRFQGKGAVEDVERDFERREGTAHWVGCAGGSLTTPQEDSSWVPVEECVDRELATPLSEFSNFPEADARYMRWRLYGTGGALTLLVNRYGPVDWRDRVEAGEPLDRILRDAVVRR